MAFFIKQNDTSPPIRSSLKDGEDNAIQIDDASVKFIMKDPFTRVVLIDAAAEIVSETNGIVQYNWLAADTESSGWFKAEWEVTYNDGKVETFPNDGYMWIKIESELA